MELRVQIKFARGAAVFGTVPRLKGCLLSRFVRQTEGISIAGDPEACWAACPQAAGQYLGGGEESGEVGMSAALQLR